MDEKETAELIKKAEELYKKDLAYLKCLGLFVFFWCSLGLVFNDFLKSIDWKIAFFIYGFPLMLVGVAFFFKVFSVAKHIFSD